MMDLKLLIQKEAIKMENRQNSTKVNWYIPIHGKLPRKTYK